ncbi:MAG: acyl carrier protein [Desulforhabdus sp.]|jgi:acyl carrier protein|nr:acyl carrier protein [Desulforhabdus sp.]
MMDDPIKAVVLRLLGEIAPEADLAHINSGKRFRDQFEFDSVDFLNFAVGLQEELKIRIPEDDFPRLATLDGCVEYLKSKTR